MLDGCGLCRYTPYTLPDSPEGSVVSIMNLLGSYFTGNL